MRNPPRSCDLHGGFFAPSGLPKPLPLGEVSPKVTERASPAGKSCCAAMGRLFVRAILSLCKSCLAAALPSQSRRKLLASSPKGGALGMSVRLPFVQPLSLLRSTRPGCGSQHPPRSACVLLAAAPTAPPCFRHWRRSSPLPLVGEPLAKPFTLRGYAGEVIFPTVPVNLWKMHE